VREWTKAVDEELHPGVLRDHVLVSHRHTILRNGAGSFEQFLARGASLRARRANLSGSGSSSGSKHPGGRQIKLYDAYLHKMEHALAAFRLARRRPLTMADIAMAPYVNRRGARMDGLWETGACRASRHGSRACARRPTSALPSSTGCLRSSHARCARTARSRARDPRPARRRRPR